MHAPLSMEHRHSGISLRLRGEVLESELLLNVGLAYLTSMAAMNSHPDVDIGKAGDMVKHLYFDALNSIPYLTGGKSGTDAIQEERQKAIDKFKRYRDAIFKKKPSVDGK